MDILNQYGSDSAGSDSGSEAETATTLKYAQPVVRQYKVDTAPDAIGNRQIAIANDSNKLALLPPVGAGQQREMRHNMEYAQMMQPLVGPADPDGTLLANRPTTTTSSSIGGGGGTAEKQAIEEAAFREQERLFWRRGSARDPSVGAGAAAMVGNGKGSARAADAGSPRDGGKRARRRRDKAGDPAIVRDEGAYQGPWAQFEGEKKKTSGPTDAQRAEHEQRMAAFAEASGAADGAPRAPKPRPAYVAGQPERTELHAQTERDYQGRTYMHVPGELRRLGNAARSGDGAGAQTAGSAPPSRLLKEWKGAHAGGASAVRFIPASGHLLLSSGMDGMVKLFDAHGSLALLRSYGGHSLGVRDISFAPDGRSFLSSSYDGLTKLWDTETGACTAAFAASNRGGIGSGGGRRGASPNVARFCPEDANVFLAGLSDKRIVQWDVRARESTLEYNQHLGAVNSLTFFDSSRRFVSSSDDKTMRVWEFGIPVVIKLIADAAMHSVPAVALHPSGRWLAGQSMDNRIVVFGTGDRIKPHRRKVFAGHLAAGFACQPAFAPDGGVLASGDAEGRVWCWDWRSAAVVARWSAHDKVAICADWHPCLPSRLATCSWDGSVKYWE
ncbi:hypothetical protein GGI11_001800 [Coemansia sp. RSA 2049]|nr:hypothetical protein H4217_003635 [Coemansia sp. RSA 1939]KAJ2522176.1 hypothetical protein GGI11_001800 [Coemansia sp. RSA 2049]KAJ2616736.1 hypothetical protein EV177_000930 [Coemansia sp. RSA 1804]KAJ2694725.1 hypothetical protein GGH99_000541 [Coemansia sp. RSA 1285]